MDNKYGEILSDTEFIQCTLAQGHFCSQNTALHHIDSNTMCLTAIFLRNNNKINKQRKLALTNITGLQANYLDEGNWVISVKETNCLCVTSSNEPNRTFYQYF